MQTNDVPYYEELQNPTEDSQRNLTHSPTHNGQEELTGFWKGFKIWVQIGKGATTFITNWFPPEAFILYYALLFSDQKFNDNWGNEDLLRKFKALTWTFACISFIGAVLVAKYSREDKTTNTVREIKKLFEGIWNSMISPFGYEPAFEITEDTRLLSPEKALMHDEVYIFPGDHEGPSFRRDELDEKWIPFSKHAIGISLTLPIGNNERTSSRLCDLKNIVGSSKIYLATTEYTSDAYELNDTPSAIACHPNARLFLLKHQEEYYLATKNIKNFLSEQDEDWSIVKYENQEPSDEQEEEKESTAFSCLRTTNNNNQTPFEIPFGLIAATEENTDNQDEETKERSSSNRLSLSSYSGVSAFKNHQEVYLIASHYEEKENDPKALYADRHLTEDIRQLTLAGLIDSATLPIHANNEEYEPPYPYEHKEGNLSPGYVDFDTPPGRHKHLFTGTTEFRPFLFLKQPEPESENKNDLASPLLEDHNISTENSLIFSHFTLQEAIKGCMCCCKTEEHRDLYQFKTWAAIFGSILWATTKMLCRIFASFGVFSSGFVASTTIVELGLYLIKEITGESINDHAWWIHLLAALLLALPTTISFFSYNVGTMLTNMDRFMSNILKNGGEKSKWSKLSFGKKAEICLEIFLRTAPYALVCVLFATQALDIASKEFKSLDAKAFIDNTISLTGYIILNAISGFLSFAFTRIPPYLVEIGLIYDDEQLKHKTATHMQLKKVADNDPTIYILQRAAAFSCALEFLCTYLKNMDGALNLLHYILKRENTSLPTTTMENFWSMPTLTLIMTFMALALFTRNNSKAEQQFSILPARDKINEKISHIDESTSRSAIAIRCISPWLRPVVEIFDYFFKLIAQCFKGLDLGVNYAFSTLYNIITFILSKVYHALMSTITHEANNAVIDINAEVDEFDARDWEQPDEEAQRLFEEEHTPSHWSSWCSILNWNTDMENTTRPTILG